MSSQDKDKSGWYPGKYIKEKRKSVTSSSSSSTSSSTIIKEDEIDLSNSKSSSVTENTTISSSSQSPTSSSSNSTYSPSLSNNNEVKTKQIQRENSLEPTIKQRQVSYESNSSSTSSSSTIQSNNSIQKQKEKEKEKKTSWYPGKAFGRKPPSWATSGNSHSPVTRRSSLTPVGGSAPVQIVGNVLIKVLGAKYMSATRPNFEVWVGSQVETFHYISLDPSNGSTNEVFEGNFPVGDLTSDVFILVKEEYSVGGTDNFVGRIVIPLSAYVTPKGPKPSKLEWMSIYPIMDSQNPMGLNRFGLPFLPGSAMTKTKHSLGFLAVEVQLLLTPGPVYTLYLQGEPPKKMLRTLADFAADHNDDDEIIHFQQKEVKKFNAEEFIRTFLRIKRFLTTPFAVLSPVLKFPEVFILIGLYGFLCFGADAHHIPLILFFVVLLNGFLSSSEKKNFTGKILWNSLIDSRKINSSTSNTSKSLTQEQLKSSEYLIQTLNEPLYDAQKELDRLINKFEVLANIWNFSDLQVSILFYGVFLGLSLFSSLIIYIFSIRPLLFIIGTIFLLLNSIREYFPELMTATLDEQDDTRDNLMYNIKNNTTKFWMLLERVPSDVILEHRHISRTCIVEDEGIEMQDAASKKVM